MTEKIRVDFSGYVDIDISPELKELLDKYFNNPNDDIEIYDKFGEKIFEYIDKELYKKGFHGINIDNWDTVRV